jgi:hypothetical protein
MHPNDTLRHDERLEALEPDYALTADPDGSIWRPHGHRRRDGLAVIVEVLPHRATQHALARAEVFFAPLLDEVGVLEVRAVGDDLFIVWERVGDVALSDLDEDALSPGDRALITRATLRALDAWHARNRSYGFPSLSGVRLSLDLRRAWLVSPDLHRIVEGLSLGDPSAERLAFERALSRWRGAPDGAPPLAPEDLFAPRGQRDAFSLIAPWDHAEPARVELVSAPEGYGKTTLLNALELAWSRGAATVSIDARARPAGSWIPAALDGLADHALAMTPLLERRLVARVRSTLGGHLPMLCRLSPRWRALLGEEAPERHLFSERPAEDALVVRLFATLLGAFSSHRPVALLLDDADAELDLLELTSAELSLTRAQGVRVVGASSLPDERAITLPALSGEALEELVSHELGRPVSLVRRLCAALEARHVTSPRDVLVALRLARTRGWLGEDPDTGEATLEHLGVLASGCADHDALLELLGDLDAPTLQRLSLVSTALPIGFLATLCAVSADEMRALVADARALGVLDERHQRVRLATFAARAVRSSIPHDTHTALHRDLASRLILSGTHHLSAPHILEGWPAGPLDDVHLGVLAELTLSETSAGRASALDAVLSRLVDAASEAENSADALARARLALTRAFMTRRELARAQDYTEVPEGASLRSSLALLRERVVLWTFSGQYGRALDEGLSALAAAQVNVHRPDVDLAAHVSRALEVAPSLHDLPHASPEEALRQSLIAALLPVSYITRRASFDALVTALVDRTLTHGVSLDSVRGLTTLGQLACVRLGAVTQGTDIGMAAYALASRTAGHPYLPVVCSDLANFILPWSGRIDDCIRFNRLGRRAADMLGDLQYAGYIRMHDLFNRLTYGVPFDELRARGDRYLDASRHNTLAHGAIGAVLDALSCVDAPHGDPALLAEPQPSASPLVRHLHHLAYAVVSLARADLDALAFHVEAARAHFDSTEGWAAPTTLNLYLTAACAYHTGGPGLSTARAALELVTARVDALDPLVLHVRGLELVSLDRAHDACVLFDRAITAARDLDLHAYTALVAQDAVTVAARAGLDGFADASRRAAARAFDRWGVPQRAVAFGLRRARPHAAPSTSTAGLVRAALTSSLDTLRSLSGAPRAHLALFTDASPTVFATVDPLCEDVVEVGDGIDHGRPTWRTLNMAFNAPHLASEPGTHVHRRGDSVLVVSLPDSLAPPPDLDVHLSTLLSWSSLLHTSSLSSGQLTDSSLALAIRQLSEHLFFVCLDGSGARLDGRRFPLHPSIQAATVELVRSREPASLSSPLSPDSDSADSLVGLYFPRVFKLQVGPIEPALWISGRDVSPQLKS